MTILAIDKGVRLRLSTWKGPLSGRTPFVYGDPPTTSDEACTDARELPRAWLQQKFPWKVSRGSIRKSAQWPRDPVAPRLFQSGLGPPTMPPSEAEMTPSPKMTPTQLLDSLGLGTG